MSLSDGWALWTGHNLGWILDKLTSNLCQSHFIDRYTLRSVSERYLTQCLVRRYLDFPLHFPSSSSFFLLLFSPEFLPLVIPRWFTPASSPPSPLNPAFQRIRAPFAAFIAHSLFLFSLPQHSHIDRAPVKFVSWVFQRHRANQRSQPRAGRDSAGSFCNHCWQRKRSYIECTWKDFRKEAPMRGEEKKKALSTVSLSSQSHLYWESETAVKQVAWSLWLVASWEAGWTSGRVPSKKMALASFSFFKSHIVKKGLWMNGIWADGITSTFS